MEISMRNTDLANIYTLFIPWKMSMYLAEILDKPK